MTVDKKEVERLKAWTFDALKWNVKHMPLTEHVRSRCLESVQMKDTYLYVDSK